MTAIPRFGRAHVRAVTDERALCGAAVREDGATRRRICSVCLGALLELANSSARAERNAKRILGQLDALTLALNVAADEGRTITPKQTLRIIGEALGRTS